LSAFTTEDAEDAEVESCLVPFKHPLNTLSVFFVSSSRLRGKILPVITRWLLNEGSR
jgi:hypothetical protein